MSDSIVSVTFTDVSIEDLESSDQATIDAWPFGVIGMDPNGTVAVYNLTESRLAGLSMSRVVGKNFFADVGICMNNYLVAQKFEDRAALDETISYVLTLRMRPTPVKLRLLKKPGVARSYILVQR